MSDDKSLIKKFFERSFPTEKDEEENNKKELKIDNPPKLRQTFIGQKLDTRRVEEYERTVKAYERVVRATGNLERAVGDFNNNVDTRIKIDKEEFLSELEQIKQKREDFHKNSELREQQRQSDIMEEKLKQARVETEMMELKAKQASAKADIAEEEARAKKVAEPSPQPRRPKTRMEKLDEYEKRRRKIKETFAQKKANGIAYIKERAEAKGEELGQSELEEEIIFWDRKEAEELDKLEKEYR